MKLLILGAGGIGGYIGGRLAEAGADVTFLVRPRRRAQLERDGLVVVSPLGDMRFHVKTVLATELKPEFDLVLLTCKAYDLDSAMDAIAPAMGEKCCVVPMLNGISHLARLDSRFGAESVLGGAVVVAATLDDDGTVRHTNNHQRMVFGERAHLSRDSARTTAFAADLGPTQLDWVLSPNIEQDMWEKIVVLSCIAAMTCLFRASIGEIVSSAGGLQAITRTFDANIAIATAEGYAPRAQSIEFGKKTLFDPASTLTASMLRDLERGGAVESDHIVGFMLDRARAHGIDDTMLSVAMTHLKAYEARRAAERL